MCSIFPEKGQFLVEIFEKFLFVVQYVLEFKLQINFGPHPKTKIIKKIGGI